VAVFGDMGVAEADGSLDPGDSNELPSNYTLALLHTLRWQGRLDMVANLGAWGRDDCHCSIRADTRASYLAQRQAPTP
jgi:hypothetical protein